MPIDLTNWMSHVRGSQMLSELSIPGTHDSGSRTPASEAARLRTQTRTIPEQLSDGIRFLDIRLGYTNKAFALYHESASSGVTFQFVLDTCKAFLAAHPRETIIMSIKKEDKAPTSGNTAGVSFQQRFDTYVTSVPGLFYQKNAIPTLGAVRGKIVLFRRFALDKGTLTANRGINAFRGFPDDKTGPIVGPPRLEIQDRFSQLVTSREVKWTAVKDLLNGASAAGNADVLYVNFASAAGIANAANHDFPSAVAADINPALEKYFNEPAHKQGRFGIVITDFETAARNTLIVQTNTLFNAGYWIVNEHAAVTALGSAGVYTRSGTGTALTQAIAIAATPGGGGYFLLTRGGGVYGYGQAVTTAPVAPEYAPAVSIAVKPPSATSPGIGYWVLSLDGKVHRHVAPFYGQLESGTNLQAVSIVATPNGAGYWILASNGRIHAYGNANEVGDRRDDGKIAVSMAATLDGGGYWILTSNGAVRPFGNAVDYGQGDDGATARAIATAPDGRGYWILYTNGQIKARGSATDIGRATSTTPAVGLAVDR